MTERREQQHQEQQTPTAPAAAGVHATIQQWYWSTSVGLGLLEAAGFDTSHFEIDHLEPPPSPAPL